MRARGIGLALLVFCVLGGIVAALFSPVLAATLTLPPPTPGTVAQATSPAQARPTATKVVVGPTPTATSPATQPTQATSGFVLAHDTFQRPDQQTWGTSSDGRPWVIDGNNNGVFAIVNHAGQVSGGIGPFQATLNSPATDSELLFSGTVSVFDPAGDTNLGGVLRWQDANNWYKVLIDGTNLQLIKDVGGTIAVLKTQAFQATAGIAYTIRFRTMGSYLFARVWPSAQAEPLDWTVEMIDTSLANGICGIRVKLMSTAVVRINSFLETSVTNTD